MGDTGKQRGHEHRLALLVGAGYLTALLLILLWPTPVTRPFEGPLAQLDRMLPGSVAVLEFACNIILFLPAGALLAVLLPHRLRLLALPIGAAGSALFELTQRLFLKERVADVSDVVANTVGTVLGVVGVIVWGRRARRATNAADR